MGHYRSTLDDKLNEPEKGLAQAGGIGVVAWVGLVTIAAMVMIPLFGRMATKRMPPICPASARTYGHDVLTAVGPKIRSAGARGTRSREAHVLDLRWDSKGQWIFPGRGLRSWLGFFRSNSVFSRCIHETLRLM
jgi:hypothetical protein